MRNVALVAWTVLVAVVFRYAGYTDGCLYVRREHLTDRGCVQIARWPELWECEGGERVEVKP